MQIAPTIKPVDFTSSPRQLPSVAIEHTCQTLGDTLATTAPVNVLSLRATYNHDIGQCNMSADNLIRAQREEKDKTRVR